MDRLVFSFSKFFREIGLVVFFLLFYEQAVVAQDDIFLSSPSDTNEQESLLPTEAPIIGEQKPVKSDHQKTETDVTDETDENNLFSKPKKKVAVLEPEIEPEKDLSKNKKQISRSAEEDERAIPLRGIGLIVEADGSEQMKTTLAHYYRLTRERELNPAPVFLVINGRDDTKAMKEAFAIAQEEINRGVPDNTAELEAKFKDNPRLAENAMNELFNRIKTDKALQRRLASAFTIIPTMQPPEIYKVKKLPSWYLMTETGQILLEGLEDPSGLLTMSGKFVEPIGVVEEAVVTPTK
jgi:hypothetical protein